MIKVGAHEYATMGDAAFAAELDGTSFDIGGGYLVSANALHGWSESDWDTLPGYKLPIYVATPGLTGHMEALSAVRQLHVLGVPEGKRVALDMETRVDKTYVASFGEILNHEGYGVWVYGSASSVFGNPVLQGYWVADYKGIGPFMYADHTGIRATQYQSGPRYDSSLVKPWTLRELWK